MFETNICSSKANYFEDKIFNNNFKNTNSSFQELILAKFDLELGQRRQQNTELKETKVKSNVNWQKVASRRTGDKLNVYYISFQNIQRRKRMLCKKKNILTRKMIINK